MCEGHMIQGSDWSKHVCEQAYVFSVSPLITTVTLTEIKSVLCVYVKFSWNKHTSTATLTSWGEMLYIPLHNLFMFSSTSQNV